MNIKKLVLVCFVLFCFFSLDAQRDFKNGQYYIGMAGTLSGNFDTTGYSLWARFGYKSNFSLIDSLSLNVWSIGNTNADTLNGFALAFLNYKFKKFNVSAGYLTGVAAKYFRENPTSNFGLIEFDGKKIIPGIGWGIMLETDKYAGGVLYRNDFWEFQQYADMGFFRLGAALNINFGDTISVTGGSLLLSREWNNSQITMSTVFQNDELNLGSTGWILLDKAERYALLWNVTMSSRENELFPVFEAGFGYNFRFDRYFAGLFSLTYRKQSYSDGSMFRGPVLLMTVGLDEKKD